MLRAINKKIEEKRDSKDWVHKSLVFAKDIAVKYLFFPLFPLARQAIWKGAVQNEKELGQFLKFLKGKKLDNILEIGTMYGGTLYVWCKIASENAKIISIDLPPEEFSDTIREKIKIISSNDKGKKQKLYFVREDSHEKKTRMKIERILKGDKLDFLFIDGDHTYDSVKKDFEMYSDLVKEGGVVAFHDIYTPHFQVKKFWKEIKGNFRHQEFFDRSHPIRIGIGVIRKLDRKN